MSSHGRILGTISQYGTRTVIGRPTQFATSYTVPARPQTMTSQLVPRRTKSDAQTKQPTPRVRKATVAKRKSRAKNVTFSVVADALLVNVGYSILIMISLCLAIVLANHILGAILNRTIS